MSQSADPFMLQKVEFLEMELQESKERESKLKKTYDSLLGLLNATSPAFRNHTESELSKVNDTYQRELSDLKRKSKEEKDRLESECRALRKHCTELELDLKQGGVTAEREKLEMRQVISQLEADKSALESTLQAEEAEKCRQSLKGDLSQRLQQLTIQFEQYKEASDREKEKLSVDCEAKLTEVSNSYAKEKSDLLNLVSQNEGKTNGLREKLTQIRGENDALKSELANLKRELDGLRGKKRYSEQVEEDKQRLLSQVQSLQGKIQGFSLKQSPRLKTTPRESASDRPLTEISALKSQLIRSEKTVEMLKIELSEERKRQETMVKTSVTREDRPLQVCNGASAGKLGRGEEGIMVEKMREQMEEKCRVVDGVKDQLRDSKVELAQLQLQKERLQIDLEKMNIESKQLKLDWSVEREKLTSEVTKLKNEVKFLIGKLVKAKGKLAVEGELNETLRKGGISDSFRSKSVLKGRATTRGVSPQRSFISPLNLSSITRAESPCISQSIEAYKPGEL